jgi:hypothetical protein
VKDFFQRRRLMAVKRSAKIPEHIVHRLDLVSALAAESAAARTGLILEGIRTGYVLNASGVGLLALGAQLLGFTATEIGWHSLPFFVGLTTTAAAHFLAYFGQTHTTETYAFLLREQLEELSSSGSGDADEQENGSDGHLHLSTVLSNGALALMVVTLTSFVAGGVWLLLSSVS